MLVNNRVPFPAIDLLYAYGAKREMMQMQWAGFFCGSAAVAGFATEIVQQELISPIAVGAV
jgi:hypothetical protein